MDIGINLYKNTMTFEKKQSTIGKKFDMTHDKAHCNFIMLISSYDEFSFHLILNWHREVFIFHYKIIHPQLPMELN